MKAGAGGIAGGGSVVSPDPVGTAVPPWSVDARLHPGGRVGAESRP